LSRIARIQMLVRHGLYYLTEHDDEEAAEDGFDTHGGYPMSMVD